MDTFIKDMLDNAVHIGYRRQYWSPKMRDYIYGVQNGIHVFDLYKTKDRLENLKEVLTKLSQAGKEILIVGTKIQARDLVKDLAQESNQYYVVDKWIPGLLTNFSTLKRRIATYVKLEKDLEGGFLDALTKKEKSMKMKELVKLRQAYEGVKELKKVPDAVFVIDGHYENLALTEAKTLGIPSYALLGNTGDIDMCTDFVPCNVNSIKSIKFVLDYLRTSITRKKQVKTFDPKEVRNTQQLKGNNARPPFKKQVKETTEEPKKS